MFKVKNMDQQQSVAWPGLIESCAVLVLMLASPIVAAQYRLEDPTRPGHWQESNVQQMAKASEPALTLDSILLSPNRRVAMINGHLMSEGESRNGVKLLKVGEREVTVNLNGQHKKLTLKPVADLRR